jgi:hypothetical protein
MSYDSIHIDSLKLLRGNRTRFEAAEVLSRMACIQARPFIYNMNIPTGDYRGGLGGFMHPAMLPHS